MAKTLPLPIAGGAYEYRSPELNAQTTVNMYPIIGTQESGERYIMSLVRTPGLPQFVDLDTTATGIRGMGKRGNAGDGKKLYVVTRNAIYSVNTNGTKAALAATLNTASGYVQFINPGIATDNVVLSDGHRVYTINSASVLQVVADGDLTVSGNNITYLDGFYIVPIKDTSSFQISNALTATVWDAADTGTTFRAPDKLLITKAHLGKIWAFGTDTIQIFTNTGASAFPFETVGGGGIIQRGLGANNSIGQWDRNLFFLGDDKRVYKTEQESVIPISTEYLDYILGTYSDISDCRAWVYGQDGHIFYFMQFNTANVTWVYDLTTNKWHRRKAGVSEDNHWAQCHIEFDGKQLVGGTTDCIVYQLDLDVYGEAGGDNIKTERTLQTIQAQGKKMFWNEIEVIHRSGVGSSTDTAAPSLDLVISDDGGNTFSTKITAPLGASGVFDQRTRYTRLGSSRQRTLRFTCSDGVPLTLVGGEYDADIGAF